MNLQAKFLFLIISIILISCSSYENNSNSDSDLDKNETTENSRIYEPAKNFDNPSKLNLSPNKTQSYSNEFYTYILYSEDSLELARTTINLGVNFAKGRYEIVNAVLNDSNSSEHWNLKMDDTTIDSYECKDFFIQRVSLILEGFRNFKETKKKIKYNISKDNVFESTIKSIDYFSHRFQWEFVLPTKDLILIDRELNENNRRNIIEREYKLKKDNLYRVNKDVSQKISDELNGKFYEIGKEEDVFLIRRNGVKTDSLIHSSNRKKRSNVNFCREIIKSDK